MIVYLLLFVPLSVLTFAAFIYLFTGKDILNFLNKFNKDK